MISQKNVDEFNTSGYTIVRKLFSLEEVEFYKDHYMEIRDCAAREGGLPGMDLNSDDPLLKYPRLIHPHRIDKVSLDWLLDPRLNECVTALTGEEPYAAQTMLYYKPAGARGQALHQDNSILRAVPGTCVAAWMALDPCDEENGCLQVVPNSGGLPFVCNQEMDLKLSFTGRGIKLPEGVSSIPVIMEPGDVFFFNGNVIHGSLPNVSKDRFRRTLIAHYVTGDATKCSAFYHPLLRMDGSVVEMPDSPGGGSCGTMTTVDGVPVVEMAGDRVISAAMAQSYN